MPLRITTWNVNGIRNPFGYQPWRENRTFQAMFDTLEADIVVMQETKIQRKDLRDDMVLVPGWDVFFSLPKYKKGYSGVAIYTRSSKCCPIRAEEGMMGVLCPPNSSTAYRDLPVEQQIGGYPTSGQLSDSVDEQTLDSEGRCVILEFPAFVLIGVYSPATRDETRTEFREAYIDAMNVRIRNLVAMGKQVFLCGDLNIVRSEMDTAGLAERLRKEGMTIDDFFSMPSRQFLNNLVFGGRAPGEEGNGSEGPVLWDLCREFHPTRAGMYTCWDTRKNARPGNFGSRIDYVLCSSGIKDWFVDSNIQEGLLGSDHCPVYATISDTVSVDDNKVPIEDVMNPTGMFENGQRQREWSSKDLLPTSAKLIPEFDRRQSIKDMFFKKAAPSATTKQKPMAENSQKTQTVREVIHPNINNKELDGKNIPAASQPSEKVPRGTTESTDKSRSDASSAFSMHSLPPKRQATSAVTPTRPQKKGKLIPDKDSSTKSSLGRSQSSLKGFFKPKDSGAAASTKLGDDGITKAAANSINSPGNLGPKHDGQRIATLEAQSAESAELDLPKTASGTQNPGSPSDKVFDPIEAKESWSKLLGKRIVPKCEHGDDCQSLVTKKPGINCGRSFFMCSRPLGPSGDKERGTEFRCGTFIWSSDWNGRQ